MPFDTQQFLDVFADYNTSVFPAQILLLVAGLLILRLADSGDVSSSRIATSILSALWLWMGYVYHWVFFTRINDLAIVFGAMFVVQAAILFYAGVIRNDLRFERQSGARRSIGTLVVVYALVIYPLIGMAVGHSYPYSPTFGLPCPTTIFTLGLLIRSSRRVPFYVPPLMLVWAAIGSSAAYSLGVTEDLGLLVAGVCAAAFVIADRLERLHTPTGLAVKEN